MAILMHPDLQSLLDIVPPPEAPSGLDRSWEQVEKEIGTQLPADYKEFIDRFGSGVLCKFVNVWNIRDPSIFIGDLLEVLCGEVGMMQSYQRSRSAAQAEWPPMYPEQGGLLPFATMIDVNNVAWVTAGSPSKWDVLYWGFDDDSVIHCKGDGFVSFWLKWLTGEYSGSGICECDEPLEFTPVSSS